MRSSRLSASGSILARTAVLLASLLPSSAHAQAQPPSPDQPPVPRAVAATRADLARAYTRFDRLFMARPPKNEEIADYNRKFDQASLSFFSGRFNSAVRTLQDMSAVLSGSGGVETTVLSSLRLRIEPVVLTPATRDSALLRIDPFWDPGERPAGNALPFTLHVVARGRSLSELPVSLTLGTSGPVPPTTISLAGMLKSLPAGDYTLEAHLSVKGTAAVEPIGTFSLVDRPLEELKAELLDRIDALKSVETLPQRAIHTAKARASLISSTPSDTNSAQFLTPMHALTLAVQSEIDALAKGTNPYTAPGESWRVVRIEQTDVPCRIFVPDSPDRALPLLVAYHGAGGDESMFFEGYGSGIIKSLATAKHMIVACPLTYSGSAPAAFDRVVEDLRADFNIDPSRIYVLGHSMGGGATTTLAIKRSRSIAAACCIAGLGQLPKNLKTPLLVVGGELDPLFALARFNTAKDAAAKTDIPAEFRLLPDYGHTLSVGASLPSAIDWLLTHKLEPAP